MLERDCGRAYAHPNIALVKYWGKMPGTANVPAVESISLTLDTLLTQSEVSFVRGLAVDTLALNGQVVEGAAAARLTGFLDLFRGLAQTQLRARLSSTNNFPTGAGLASSASGYAALAVATAAALRLTCSTAQLASLARQGSGSAARSLYGGFVHLQRCAVAAGYDTAVEVLAASAAWPLRVVLGITTRARKAVGSTAGMERTRLTSPYYAAWLQAQAVDIQQARAAIAQRAFAALATVAEHSCLKMHALAMSAQPPLLYWNATTVAGMQALWQLRQQGVPVFFSVDAGPQLKAICEASAEAEVQATLRAVPGMLQVQGVGLGQGAQQGAPPAL